MKMLILIYASASEAAGMGHAARCAALASCFSSRHQVYFDLGAVDSAMRVPVIGLLSPEVTAVDNLDPILSRPEGLPRVEIFDGYDVQTDQMKTAQDRGSFVVRIEDRSGNYKNCDALICHGAHAEPSLFEVDSNCKMMLGPKYSLVNPVFFEHSATPGTSIERLFFSLGAGVNFIDAETILADILSICPNMSVEAVLPRNQGLHQKADDAPALSGVTYHKHLQQSDLAALMAECDAAVTAGGGTCLETMAIGLPVYLVAISDNQTPPCMAMDKIGLARFGGCLNAPDEKPLDRRNEKLIHFLQDDAERRQFIAACNQVFNESGAGRVVRELEAIMSYGRHVN